MSLLGGGGGGFIVSVRVHFDRVLLELFTNLQIFRHFLAQNLADFQSYSSHISNFSLILKGFNIENKKIKWGCGDKMVRASPIKVQGSLRVQYYVNFLN